MRIISGKYKGRRLKGFNLDSTRPTMDRVKESIFGIIQNNIKDSVVLDLFAGSGSLGLEAISNGAKKLVLVDKEKKVVDVLRDNAKGIVEDVEILTIDYKKYLKETDLTFDIIFLDPPYRLNLMNKALKIIEERKLLNNGGIVVCEFENIRIETNLTLIREKKYGSKSVHIYINE